MSRMLKLNDRLLRGEKLRFDEFQYLMVSGYGFVGRKGKGSHRIYTLEGARDQLTVQPNGKDAQPYQLRELRRIIREYDLKLDENG